MSTDTNEPATQGRSDVAALTAALATTISRFEAAGAPPAEVAGVLLLLSANGAARVGATVEQFAELARDAWVEVLRLRGAR